MSALNHPPTREPALPRTAGALADGCVPLPRAATFTPWLAGRAGRRRLCERVGGDKPLRRAEGDPAKDRVLRALNDGERGGRFAPTAQLEVQSLLAQVELQTAGR